MFIGLLLVVETVEACLVYASLFLSVTCSNILPALLCFLSHIVITTFVDTLKYVISWMFGFTWSLLIISPCMHDNDWSFQWIFILVSRSSSLAECEWLWYNPSPVPCKRYLPLVWELIISAFCVMSVHFSSGAPLFQNVSACFVLDIIVSIVWHGRDIACILISAVWCDRDIWRTCIHTSTVWYGRDK